MYSSSSSNLDVARIGLAGSFVTAVLGVLVILVAWLQFQWLTQLSEQEEARRRVALDVAATNFSEFMARELNLLLARATQAASLEDLIGSEPLLGAVVTFESNSSARVTRSSDGFGSPAGWAELHQLLGWPLTKLLGTGQAQTGLWLSPAVLVICRETCQAGVLSRDRIVEQLVKPAVDRMFADFGSEVAVLVSIDSQRVDAALYPADARLRKFQVTDVTENFLPGVPVIGPPETQWLVKVNHGGTSLEAAVAGSHFRNVLLSIGVLSLLVVSVVLVVFNARRQSVLARERLYFIAGVSHELRTPLAVISTAAENLADATIDDIEQTRNYGQLIHSEVRKLRTMIENVLQFAQSASSTRPRVWSKLRVSDLMDDVIEESSQLLSDHELRLDIPATLPSVSGDSVALRSVFNNLLANAAYYSKEGNWIEISARAVRVQPSGRAVRISISNPIGALDVDPARFFEPFYRGTNAYGSKHTGTGIGLAVARHIADQHGGGIRVHTERDGVITFTLLLPVDER